MYQIIKVNKVYVLLLSAFFALFLFSCAQQPDHVKEPQSEEIGVVVTEELYASAAASNLGGYASEVSVEPGKSIDFHISTSINGSYDLMIWREGPERTLMSIISDLDGNLHNCENKYDTGCNWPVAVTFTVPENWTSGAYTVDIPISGSTRQILFWVREDDPGSTSNILFLSSFNTEVAYTSFGGKSLYDFSSSDDQKATAVTLDRPLRGNGSGQYLKWDGRFPIWAEKEGYTIEYAADYDLEFDADLLTHYDVVVIGGHSEYWTWDMRQRLKIFIDGGGRLVNLSGNTMWWQVRFEDNGRTMVGYKDYAADPETDRSLVTDLTWDYPILDTEYAIIGVHFKMGGYFPWGNISYDNGYGGYGVQEPNHWVFANTDLAFNDVFGRTDDPDTAAIEHEVDGTTFNCDTDGQTILGPIGNSGTPDNFTVLAAAPAFQRKRMGFGVMGIYTNPNGGATFSASSIGWAVALDDPEVGQIMKNVLDAFSSPDLLPQEPQASTDTAYLFYDRFNCNRLQDNPAYGSASSEWNTMPAYNYHEYARFDDLRLTDACGVSGAGLMLPINYDNTTKLYAQVKPNWGGTAVLYTQAYLNLSELTIENNDQFELFHHTHEPHVVNHNVIGIIEIQKINDQIEVRYQTDYGDTEWVAAPDDRPFLLQTEWHNPEDRIALWIDEAHSETAVSIPDDVEVNRMDMVLRNVDGSTNGHLCIDEYAFDDVQFGFEPLPYPEAEITVSDLATLSPGTGETVTLSVTNVGNVDERFDLTAVANEADWTFEFSEETTRLLEPGESQLVTLTITPPTSARSDVQHNVTISTESMLTETRNQAFLFSADILAVDGFMLSQGTSLILLPHQSNIIVQTITNHANYADSYTLLVLSDDVAWGVSLTQQVVGPLLPGESATVPLFIEATTNFGETTKTKITFEVTSQQSNKSAKTIHSVEIKMITIFIPLIIR